MLKFLLVILLIISCSGRVDLSNNCAKIEDQKDFGTCSSFAIAYDMERLIKLKYHKNIKLSELYIFNNARLISGNLDLKSLYEGVHMKDAILALTINGACSEEEFPYEFENMNKQPPTNLKVLYFPTKITVFQPSVTRFKKKLNENKTIICGLNLFQGMYFSYEGNVLANFGIDFSKLRGAHAIHIVGYDDETRKFKVQNSFGKDSGDKGYIYIPYEIVECPYLVVESFIIEDVTRVIK